MAARASGGKIARAPRMAPLSCLSYPPRAAIFASSASIRGVSASRVSSTSISAASLGSLPSSGYQASVGQADTMCRERSRA